MANKYDPLKMVGRSTVKSLINYAIDTNEVLFVSEDKKRVDNFLTRNGLQLSTPLRISNSPIKIAQNQKSVNTSVDFDSEGRELSPRQIEFFKDSKIRDEEGNLRKYDPLKMVGRSTKSRRSFEFCSIISRKFAHDPGYGYF